ncbi:hypothetical protein D9757_007455 [Collybiopsis confluens]|uniref:Uncharacterized protein n=1 Tax=Collybiopsis confluens TaxID=2823264 RepID=A0A8H5HK62_9AGAR|nr:hypothetical protein D9757_007455 [Collybiopsis confluens]
MLPRFVNPHLATLPTEKTSRASVFNDDLDSNDEQNQNVSDVEERVALLNYLHKRLLDSMDFVAETSKQKRKRIKLSEDSGHSQKLDSDPGVCLFKLTSETERPILLHPPHPKPPSCYREPSYEDSESEALKRQQRSQAVAVDFDWVLEESRKSQLPFPSWKSRVMHASISPAEAEASGAQPDRRHLPSPSPPLMIFQRLQSPRKTRPPVPSDTELLVYHPYKIGGPQHPDATNKPHKTVPTVDVVLR